jgi:hypothetical protein
MSRSSGAQRLRRLGAAAGDGGAAAVGWVRQMHLGIAARGFSSVGPVAIPIRLVHDGWTSAVYAGVGGALRLGGRGIGTVAALTRAADSPVLWGRGANAIEGAANGLWGDYLSGHHPDLAITMAVRSGGHDVALERLELKRTYPSGGGRLAVFLHGLCETEDSWGRPAEDDDTPGTYGDRLRRDLGMTPLFIRYNSGLRVADNGAELSALLEQLVRKWPDEVEEIALVGHSMGGLLMRCALDAAVKDRAAWVRRVHHCVYLGTPHDGAPLARGVAVLSRALARLPETAAIASILDVRSAGIRDLQTGYVPPEEVSRLVVRGLPKVRHHVISGTLGPSDRHPLSRAFGDLLVTPKSAAGRSRQEVALEVAEKDMRELAGVSHFQLLDHPDVAEALREWLRPPAARRRGDRAVLN